MRDGGKLVLRGGFGMGFNGLEQAITTNTRFDPPFLTNSNTLTGSEIVYGTASNIYEYGALPANPALISTFNSANLPTRRRCGRYYGSRQQAANQLRRSLLARGTVRPGARLGGNAGILRQHRPSPAAPVQPL